MEALGGRAHLLQRQLRSRFGPAIRAARLSLRVISVGRESEANASGVALLRSGKVLRKARKFAQKQRQNACGHGV